MPFTRDLPDDVVKLQPVPGGALEDWVAGAPAHHRKWLEASGFSARPGQWTGVPDPDGNLDAIVFGMQDSGCLYQVAGIADSLPARVYRLPDWSREERTRAALGWGLGSYRFTRYRADDRGAAILHLDDDIADDVERLCQAQCLVRDLVNTPTEDMGPEQLADAVVSEADRFEAETSITLGDDLLSDNFPAVHAVGRAASRAPRLITLEWGERDAPLLALAGKGVCFDSGGLDIKNASGMSLMKKDMGGAAHVLALARLVMQYELPVRLFVVIPAVENAISGNAYRPGDVVHTRKGVTVEIGNTDAEGRVVLSDALALACEHLPDLVIDFATLTGAARVALGPDVPPVFSNRSDVAQALVRSGERHEDPIWELPLYAPYRHMLKSEIADINNSSKGSYAGCITAALFLEKFVEPDIPWAHIDTYAWNQNKRPGRPVGGEALGLRAVFGYLRDRYS